MDHEVPVVLLGSSPTSLAAPSLLLTILRDRRIPLGQVVPAEQVLILLGDDTPRLLRRVDDVWGGSGLSKTSVIIAIRSSSEIGRSRGFSALRVRAERRRGGFQTEGKRGVEQRGRRSFGPLVHKRGRILRLAHDGVQRL